LNPQALAEFEQPAAGSQMLPIDLIEELVDRARLGWSAKVQAGDHRRPGIDVGWQETWPADKGVDQRALASLDLPDYRNPAGVALAVGHHPVQRGGGVIVEHRPQLVCESKSGHCDLGQLPAQATLRTCLGASNTESCPALTTHGLVHLATQPNPLGKKK